MQFHSNKLPASSEKLRGGYYTPPLLAQFLVDWSVRSGNERILEPSCGDGVFVEAILNRLNTLQSTQQPFASTARLTAVEVLKEEIEKAKERASCEAFSGFEVDWVCDDFFSYSKMESDEFDLVIGNPPFIRFQHVNSDYRDLAFDLLRGYGYHPNKLANAWCSFVQISIEKLAIGGRLAMVLPAELLQVKYAAELRERLPYIFEKMSIVGFKRLVFSEIQQEVVLLLCDGKQANLEKAGQVFSYDVTDADELKDITAHLNGNVRGNGRRISLMTPNWIFMKAACVWMV